MNLGKYEILSELGHGAMGIVYRARDPIINRLVAIKTITASLATDPHLRERFYREAQSAGNLQHPNIVTIHDLGEHDQVPYIAMELIEGESLEDLIGRRPAIPLSLKLVYATQACRAFDYAHKRGIVHRDIKPANVMLTKEGVVKVVDFGIARVVETSKTKTGVLIGTFAYMSPEQFDGDHADERSDIWSLGVLFYELLSYQRPFVGETPAKLMRSITDHHPKPLTEVLADCPLEIADIVSKCLQKSPENRCQSMEELLLDLEPVSKRLQQRAVSELTEQCRRHVENNEFSDARDLLRHALQIDPDNQTVRSMFESVSAELKRILVRPKALQFVEKGRALLEQGRPQDAKVAAENALHLDSSFEPARELQRVVREELNRAQLVKGWVEAAKQHLAEGLPEEAGVLLVRARQMEPNNAEVAALQEQAEKEREERQRQLRLIERLQQARTLWTQEDYRLCIQVLVDLQKEFPAAEEILRLLETVRDDQMDQRTHALLDTQKLIEACHFKECFSLLAKLEEQFPGDTEVSSLLRHAHEAQTTYRRHQELTEAKAAIIAGEYEQAMSRLSNLQKEFPDDADISALLDDAREQQSDRRKQQGITRARELVAARRYAESADLLMRLREECPGDSQIIKLLEAVGADQLAQRKRDGLAEARRLIANRYYDEASALLAGLQADFPAETAIVKLLDTARGDKAEQHKQKELTEARAHLASKSFAEALTLLDGLAAAHPNDVGIGKLRSLAQHEHEKQAREVRIQRELDALKKLINERNYPQVISRTKELLTEFPGETNFRRMGEFAENQQKNVERDLFVQKALQDAIALFNARKYSECSVVVQNGLKVAPANVELLRLYEDAEQQQKKRAMHDRIEERVRQIRTKINQEEFSDAITLAEDTIKKFGPNTDISQLLSSAQVEFQARARKSNPESTLETIRTLVESGQFAAASRALDEALEARTALRSDPRVGELAARIKESEIPRPEPATATSLGSPAEISPSEPREYAFFQNTPIVPDPPVSDAFRGPTTSQGAATKRARYPEARAKSNPEPVAASSLVPTAVQPSLVNTIQPSEAQFIPAEIMRKHAARRRRMRSLVMSAVVLIVAAIVIFYGIRSGVIPMPSNVHEQKTAPSAPITPDATTTLEAKQRASLNAASKLVANNDLSGARQKLEGAARLKGPLTEELNNRVSEIDASENDPQLRELRQREETLWQRALKNASNNRYMDAQKDLKLILQLKPGGLHREDAQKYLDKVIPQHLQEMDLLVQARFDLSQGEFQAARDIVSQLGKNGSDTSGLVKEIDGQERGQMGKLEKEYNELSQSEGNTAILGLNSLWSKFQEIATANGPMSGEALDYVNRIPETVVQLQARLQQKDADALFKKTVQSYLEAARLSNKDELVIARTNFRSIVKAGGTHAQEAAEYLKEVDRRLADSSGSAPTTPTGNSTGRNRDSAVRSAMKLYVDAFERRDVEALRQIWPTLGAQYESFKLWFAKAQSMKMQLRIESIQFDPDGTTATVKAQVAREYTNADESEPNRLREPESFQLSEINGSWVITEVVANF
jgi:eukaryotic-like serine/threonine-protein kinase